MRLKRLKGSWMKMPEKGLLIVVSGPSGTGKGTVLKELFSQHKGLFFSVSATTRDARPGETEGVHYFFLTKEEFERQIGDNNMLEFAEYCQNYYGTPRSAVEEKRAAGFDVILDVEVKGAMHIKSEMKDAVLIFLMPPSIEELEKRLRSRGTESEEVITRRLEKARKEMKASPNYDYIVVNDNIKHAASQIESIITSEKLKPNRINGGKY